MSSVVPSEQLLLIPQADFARLLASPGDPAKRTALFAQMARFNALYAIARAGSGHIGSSFSSLDIVSWLYLNVIDADADIYYSSKGHDSPGFYAVLTGLGRLDFALLHSLRRLGGLPGHPDVQTAGVVCNSGSLGMGISKAKGMIFANRLAKRTSSVYVLMGDGELQEGQFWESLQGAANARMDELTVIIDHNKLQSDALVSEVSDLGDLEAKLAAFGWAVARCNGHDIADLDRALRLVRAVAGKPKILIADTIKGRGVSFMEHTSMPEGERYYKFHSGAPSADAYRRAAMELSEKINRAAAELSLDGISFQMVPRPEAPAQNAGQRLIPHYSEALLEAAEKRRDIVALDGDLIVDTGLAPFRERFPERFVECGIAEQDMVSMASGMALKGLLPIVHSFACFLSARPNEQIYNAATEITKIIYVGSLAGLTPGGPGHSHQAVRDISSLAAIPDFTIVEPSQPDEVAPLLDWCITQAPGSSYLRLVSVPCTMPDQAAEPFVPKRGWGRVLRPGKGLAFVGYGPTLLAEACTAAGIIDGETGRKTGIISFPWLNVVDLGWLRQIAGDYQTLVILDNHYTVGALFDRIAATLALAGPMGLTLHSAGVDRIPRCGTNDEVVRAHGLDAESLADLAKRVP
jgi:transketolase